MRKFLSFLRVMSTNDRIHMNESFGKLRTSENSKEHASLFLSSINPFGAVFRRIVDKLKSGVTLFSSKPNFAGLFSMALETEEPVFNLYVSDPKIQDKINISTIGLTSWSISSKGLILRTRDDKIGAKITANTDDSNHLLVLIEVRRLKDECK